MSNGTSTIEEFMNTTSTNGDNFQTDSRQQHYVFAKYEFVQNNPWLAFPVVLVLFAASLVGTSGNILIFLSVLFYKKVRTVESTFIVNLALSDMFVTLIADPFSIVGKLLRKHIYHDVQWITSCYKMCYDHTCINTFAGIRTVVDDVRNNNVNFH